MTPTKTYKQRRKQAIQFLTQDETRRLFKAIKKLRDRALFLTAYRHGLRVSEVSLLQRGDLDLKAGRITIQRLKGSISGVYPLQPDLLKLLRRYLRSRDDSSPTLFISNRLVPIDRTTLWRLNAEIRRCRPAASREAEISLPAPLDRFVVYAFVQAPVFLILLSGVTQAVMLPMLAVAALYFRYQRCHPELRPGKWWDFFLWLSSVGLIIAGTWAALTRIVPYWG